MQAHRVDEILSYHERTKHHPGRYAAALGYMDWETGLIGQILYLEAEAAGVQSTGIGCFFDDSIHRVLGLRSRDLQSLYNFTVGVAVLDERLQTLDAYHHLA